MILLLKTELIKIYLTPLQANISRVYIGYTWLSEFVWTLTTVKKKTKYLRFFEKKLKWISAAVFPSRSQRADFRESHDGADCSRCKQRADFRRLFYPSPPQMIASTAAAAAASATSLHPQHVCATISSFIVIAPMISGINVSPIPCAVFISLHLKSSRRRPSRLYVNL